MSHGREASWRAARPERATRAGNVVGTVRYLVRFVAICAAVAVIGSALTFLLVPQLGAIGSASHGVAEPINLDALPQRSLIYDRNGNVAATLFAEREPFVGAAVAGAAHGAGRDPRGGGRELLQPQGHQPAGDAARVVHERVDRARSSRVDRRSRCS